jgi:hypothetical protein
MHDRSLLVRYLIASPLLRDCYCGATSGCDTLFRLPERVGVAKRHLPDFPVPSRYNHLNPKVFTIQFTGR